MGGLPKRNVNGTLLIGFRVFLSKIGFYKIFFVKTTEPFQPKPVLVDLVGVSQ